MAIGLTLLASLSAYVLTGPRVAYAMARAGHSPAIAGRLTAGSRAPAVATSLQVAWAVLLLWTGSFESIVIYAGVGLALFSMLAVGSIYVLRRTRPICRARSAPQAIRSSRPSSWRHGHPDPRRLSRAAHGHPRFVAQHPGRYAGLLSLGPAQAGSPGAQCKPPTS